MTVSSSLLRGYFNYVYNPVYDFAVGRLNLYRKLQERCVERLDPQKDDRILCVGLGTGNELFHILKKNPDVVLTGIDYSESALKKAQSKAQASGKNIELSVMDVNHLEYDNGSFDKVLCIHVMDFVRERETSTAEIVRVLKPGGRFVISYPSEIEGMKLGITAFRDNVAYNRQTGHNRIISVLLSIAQSVSGMVYLPLLLRPKSAMGFRDLEKLFMTQPVGEPAHLKIEEYPLYNDYIVTGTK